MYISRLSVSKTRCVYCFEKFLPPQGLCGIILCHTHPKKCCYHGFNRQKVDAINSCEIHCSNRFVQIIWPDSAFCYTWRVMEIRKFYVHHFELLYHKGLNKLRQNISTFRSILFWPFLNSNPFNMTVRCNIAGLCITITVTMHIHITTWSSMPYSDATYQLVLPNPQTRP